MPNIAAALREEIIRPARKEIRTQVAGEQKALRHLQRANVELKRDTADLRAKL